MKQINRLSSLFYGGVLVILSITIYLSNDQLQDPSLDIAIINSENASRDKDTIDITTEEIDDTELPEENQTLLRAALAHSKSGNIEQAKNTYREILSLNINHQVASVNLAVLSLRSGDCKTASHAINHAVEVSRGSRLAKALSMQGYCLSKEEKFDEAMAAFKRSIEFRPSHSLTWKRLAHAQEKSNLSSEIVLTTLNRALALDPKNNALRLSVAKFQHERLDFRGSINTLKEKYTRLKTSFKAQELLAWNYLELEKWNNAQKHIKLAANLDKSKLKMLKAMELYGNKQHNESIDYIKSNTKLNSQTRYLLGLNYQAKNWRKTARKYFDRVKDSTKLRLKSGLHLIQLDQKGFNNDRLNEGYKVLIQAGALANYPSYLVARQLNKNGEYSQAESWLKDLTYPNPIQSVNNLYGHILWKINKKEDAIALMELIVTNKPSHQRSIRQYSRYLLGTQSAQKALQYLTKIPFPEFRAADFILLSDIHQALQDSEKSEQVLKEGLEYWSQNTDLRIAFAQVLKQNQKNEQSRHQLALVLKLDNNHPQAKQYLAEYN